MVKGSLVDRYVAAGRQLLERLDQDQVLTHAALWLHRPEDDGWILLIAMAAARHHGSKTAYEILQRVFVKSKNDLSPLTFEDITVVPPNDAFIDALRRAITTGTGISEIRFTNNTVDHVYVDDALIYRLT
jgi:hypothetical protein